MSLVVRRREHSCLRPVENLDRRVRDPPGGGVVYVTVEAEFLRDRGRPRWARHNRQRQLAGRGWRRKTGIAAADKHKCGCEKQAAQSPVRRRHDATMRRNARRCRYIFRYWSADALLLSRPGPPKPCKNCRTWPLGPAVASARTKSLPCLAKAAWGRCGERVTRPSIETTHSRCCPMPLRPV